MRLSAAVLLVLRRTERSSTASYGQGAERHHRGAGAHEAQGRMRHRGAGTLVALPLLRCNERGWVCFRESGPHMRFRRARQIQTRASRRSTRASHRLDPPVAARPAAVTRGLPASHPCWHHRPARLYHPRCQQKSLRPGRSLRCSATTGGRRHAYARSRLRRAGRWWWTGREMARARATREPCKCYRRALYWRRCRVALRAA